MPKNAEQIDSVIYDPPLVSTKTIQSIENERANPEYLSIGIKPFGTDFVMARSQR